MDEPTWEEVAGFSNYLVSDQGTVVSKPRLSKDGKRKLQGKQVTARLNKNAMWVALTDTNGKQQAISLRNIVAAAFMRKKQKYECIRHLNGDVTDCRASNLYFKSARDIASRNSKEYTLISPDGTGHTIKNMNKFCELNGLDQSALSKVARGVKPQHKGWIAAIN